MDTNMLIVKADGTKEPFDRGKLENSLRKSGAKDEAIQAVTDYIAMELTDGMTTSEIYKMAFSILKKKEMAMASRYSLRRGILSLGPTGFPFENFIAELFKEDGYMTNTGVIVKGKCAHQRMGSVLVLR